jgi:hypothetical protein
MMKSIICVLGLVLSVGAKAATINTLVADINQQILSQSDVTAAGFDWKVGDTTSYGLNMGFIKGTMVMTIKALTSDTLTLTQDLDLGFAGKQNCEMQIDTTNGQAKSLVCNGQNQSIPGNDIEVVDMKDDNIKVPAGQFECIHITAKQKSDGKTIEQWANPKLVPVMGLIKSLAPSQLGQVTIELTSFKKN